MHSAGQRSIRCKDLTQEDMTAIAARNEVCEIRMKCLQETEIWGFIIKHPAAPEKPEQRGALCV